MLLDLAWTTISHYWDPSVLEMLKRKSDTLGEVGQAPAVAAAACQAWNTSGNRLFTFVRKKLGLSRVRGNAIGCADGACTRGSSPRLAPRTCPAMAPKLIHRV